jgi:hypothetical protein
MATTTNYGWTTPDDTALVKDGASAIRTLGTAIDTTVFNNSSAGIAKTIVDAKGDIIAATAADVVARLAVGTNGQVLTAASGETTGLQWATPSSGGMTLLSTTSLSGATVTISGISGAYTHLYAYVFGLTNATASGSFRVAPNGSTTITTNFRTDTTASVATSRDNYLLVSAGQTFLNSNSVNTFSFTINNYSGTSGIKPFISFGSAVNTSNDAFATMSMGGINTTSAITSLVFSNTAGNLSTGTVLLYGVK